MFTDIYIKGEYNVKLAQITNLYTAVYWSELLNIIPQVIKKKTNNPAGFFKLDRKYITERTTLDLEQQQECDKKLAGLGMLAVDPDNPDLIAVNVKVGIGILAQDDVDKFKQAASDVIVSKEEQKEVKKKMQIRAVVNYAAGKTPDPELSKLLENWAVSVCEKAFVSKKAVDTFWDALNKYTTDINYQKKIVDIAVQRAYRDVGWAIKVFEKNNYTMITNTQKVTSGTLADVSF